MKLNQFSKPKKLKMAKLSSLPKQLEIMKPIKPIGGFRLKKATAGHVFKAKRRVEAGRESVENLRRWKGRA